MDNNFNVNIDAEAVISQNERETFSFNKQKTEFNPKNYLNARLANGETSKKLKIRLLPFSPEGGSPFQKVFVHTVRINREDGQSWRTFVCPTHNHKGERCPFCETAQQAKELRFKASNEAEKKKYGDVEFANRAKEAWVVRCIERGHEEDGVKFWLFNASRKKDGAYDKIINLFNERWEEAKQSGKTYNIFDLNNGKDLTITLSKDSNNKTVIQVTDASLMTPLSENYDQAKAWIEDKKKWDDVYTVKSYDYMAIVIQGGIPFFDKEQNKYVNKTELLERQSIVKENEMKENFTEQKRDFTNFTEQNNEQKNSEATASTTTKSPMFIDEDDLPF